MMRLPREVFDGWAGLGRFPDLFLSIEQAGPEGVAPDAALRRLLEGLATPRSHREGFAALVERGEFRAAESLLNAGVGRGTFDDLAQKDLKRALASARQQAQDEVRVRVISLARRAGVAGLGAEPPEDLDKAALDRKTEAAHLLDGWEARIREVEVRASGDFVRAAGATQKTEAGPAEVPCPPHWPWAANRAEVLGWYDEDATAPADFHARWRPPGDDASATKLLAALRHVLREQTAANVAAFAGALDAFVGHDRPEAYEAQAHADGVETRLYALADWRLPFLGAAGDQGVHLWVPRSPATGVPPRFDLGAVSFDLPSLLRLMPDRQHRRVNFLRELGGRVALTDAVPGQIDTAAMPRQQPGETSVFVRWLLDMLNVKAEDEALADMIVYYVGGRPDLLFPFLRSLFAGHPTRSTPLTPEDLARAWEESSFREAARTALLEPIADDPRGRAVLGAALYLGQPPAWTVTTADVCSAIDVFWGGGLDEGETRQALDRLAGSGLLTLVPDRVTYRFPLSGISSLLLAAIPDADAFVQSALRDACSAT